MFVETIEKRQCYNIICLKEIAFNNGWLSKSQIKQQGQLPNKKSYGQYLLALAEEKI